MNITINSQDYELTSAMDSFIRTELDTTMKRLGGEIIAIDVFLKDINGPKGGVDKQITIRAQLRIRQVVTISTAHTDLYAAIKLGANRTRRSIRRAMRRSRQFARRERYEVAVNRLLRGAPGV